MPTSDRLLLSDPSQLAMQLQFRQLAESGVRSFRRVQPKDGMRPGSPLPAHQHHVPTLVLCLSGALFISLREQITLLPGDLLLIEPGCWHDHPRIREGTTTWHLGFIAGRCDLLFFDHRQRMWGLARQDPYRSLADRLLDSDHQAEQLALVDELLHAAVAESIDFLRWSDPGILQMAAFLWNHLHEEVDIDRAVADSGLSRTTAYTKFKEFFGRSPKQELLAMRIELARHLLHRGYSVAETAERAGFPSRAELTRAFRARLGHTPSDEIPVAPRPLSDEG